MRVAFCRPDSQTVVLHWNVCDELDAPLGKEKHPLSAHEKRTGVEDGAWYAVNVAVPAAARAVHTYEAPTRLLHTYVLLAAAPASTLVTQVWPAVHGHALVQPWQSSDAVRAGHTHVRGSSGGAPLPSKTWRVPPLQSMQFHGQRHVSLRRLYQDEGSGPAHAGAFGGARGNALESTN